MTNDRETLPHLLAQARRRTLDLIGMVEESDLSRSWNAEFSPLRWHLGHVAAYEATWVLVQAGGQAFPEPAYERLFDPTRNPKADRVNLPPCSELVAFGERVRDAALAVLTLARPDHPNPLLREDYVGWLVYEHERQHQEIMAFLLQMIPPARKRQPDGWQPATEGVEPEAEMISVPAGSFALGWPGLGFAYDNEREPHEVNLPAYRIARSPVTERAFAEFVRSGGYDDERLWSADGWRWRVERDVSAPRDWQPDGAGGWTVRTMFEERSLLAGHPVVGVSFYEAEAFARWAGRRLPTEAEWERAAVGSPDGRARRFPWGDSLPTLDRANTDGHAWGTRPLSDAGRSPIGCDDLIGQVWEWTASDFAPYPGFRPFPYAGYSQAWFDGRHRVLRGGSWATAGHLCRASFRNWYEPHVREMFAGFRLAAEGGTG